MQMRTCIEHATNQAKHMTSLWATDQHKGSSLQISFTACCCSFRESLKLLKMNKFLTPSITCTLTSTKETTISFYLSCKISLASLTCWLSSTLGWLSKSSTTSDTGKRKTHLESYVIMQKPCRADNKFPFSTWREVQFPVRQHLIFMKLYSVRKKQLPTFQINHFSYLYVLHGIPSRGQYFQLYPNRWFQLYCPHILSASSDCLFKSAVHTKHWVEWRSLPIIIADMQTNKSQPPPPPLYLNTTIKCNKYKLIEIF